MTYSEIAHTSSVLEEVLKEREYQIGKFGGYAVDDEKNMPNDWLSYIVAYGGKWFPGGFPPYSTSTLDQFRKSMVKVAALAVSAIQWVDRKMGEVS